MNMSKWRLSVSIAILACVTSLAGCGGGGGGGAPSGGATAEGVYAGTLTGSSSSDFELLVLENGEFWSMYGVLTPTFFGVVGFIQGSGTSNIAGSNGGSFTSSDTRDFGFIPAVAASTNATYNTPAKTISGSVSGSLGTVGFSGGPIVGSLYDYNVPASLSTIVGAWSTTALTGESVAITVAANGSFTALSGLGCNFSGVIAPRPSGKNIFNVTLTFGGAPCALPNQPATGIAVAYLFPSGPTQLIVAVVDASRTAGTAAFGTR